ncbi:MAG TPA: Pycsar system effector family protein [Rhodothermales bacterium]
MATEVRTNEPLTELSAQAATFVYELMKERLPETVLFHNYRFTVDVANSVRQIGARAALDEDELELVTIAAWFHNTGFTEGTNGHVDASIRIAAGFLEAHEVPDEDIARVAALIRTAHSDDEPTSEAERVMHDAARAYLGRKKFFLYSDRLREEKRLVEDRDIDDREWAEEQLRELAGPPYRTKYARKRYGERRQQNLKQVQRKLGDTLDRDKPMPKAPPRGRGPGRGVETMFRSSYRNHINLSSIADSKANIMISINAILMSIIISYVGSRIGTQPWMLVPSATILVTSLVAITFAILSARPNVTSEEPTLSDVRGRQGNLLFFGNFVKMPRDRFLEGIHELMEDTDMVYDQMALDLYGLGQVLQKKYRLLWISYTVFMAGLALSVVLFFMYAPHTAGL